MSLNPWAVSVAALVVVLALWRADHSDQARAAAEQRSVSHSADKVRLLEHNKQLADALASRDELQAMLSRIDRNGQQLQVTVTGQTALINRNLTELKRRDQESAKYLAWPVPAALGLRYARPATTDPVAYRAAATGVQSGPVPAASTASPGAD